MGSDKPRGAGNEYHFVKLSIADEYRPKRLIAFFCDFKFQHFAIGLSLQLKNFYP